MLGPSLLAAPVTVPGTKVPVYLPPGSWTDIARGTQVQGGRKFVRETPLHELPLYLREGSAVAFNFRAEEIWNEPWGLNDLTHEGRTGWLIALSHAARGSTIGGSTITSRPAGHTATVTVSGAGRESAIVVLGRNLPRTVTVDGKRVPRASRPSSLRAIAQGWAPMTSPYRGIVVKLAPPRGRSTVVLSF